MSNSSKQSAAAEAQVKPLLKFAIELGPLFAFLLAWTAYGIYAATGALMVATVIGLIASWHFLGRVSPILLTTAVLVVVLGGVTLWLGDPRFIKVKPTVINVLFGAILLVGLLVRRPLLKLLLGETLHLTEDGWRQLTLRWAIFFFALAALNEIVWRNFSEGTWVNFKVFGILPLTFAFAMLQLGLIKRHQVRSSA